MLSFQSPHFVNYFDTLKNLSLNVAGGDYLVTSELEAVDFDKFTKDQYLGKSIPSSNDALYFTPKNNYFIEFKGGNSGNVKTKRLHKKNNDSIRTLVDKAGENVADIKSKYIYVLVYNPKLEPEQAIIKTFGLFAGKKDLPFNLSKFKGTSFLDVHAISPDDFDNKFIPKHFPPSP